MVKAADLTIIRAYEKNNRVCIDARADNGLECTFALSNRRGDMRGELNEQARIKRFAKMNTLNPETEETVATLNLPKHENVTAAARELTMREFYKLCELVKQCIKTAPSAEWFALNATKELGLPVSEESVREAMGATGFEEPDAWKPKDPLAIIAAELKTFMEAIGTKPSAQFLTLMKTLETA